MDQEQAKRWRAKLINGSFPTLPESQREELDLRLCAAAEEGDGVVFSYALSSEPRPSLMDEAAKEAPVALKPGDLTPVTLESAYRERLSQVWPGVVVVWQREQLAREHVELAGEPLDALDQIRAEWKSRVEGVQTLQQGLVRGSFVWTQHPDEPFDEQQWRQRLAEAQQRLRELAKVFVVEGTQGWHLAPDEVEALAVLLRDRDMAELKGATIEEGLALSWAALSRDWVAAHAHTLASRAVLRELVTKEDTWATDPNAEGRLALAVKELMPEALKAVSVPPRDGLHAVGERRGMFALDADLADFLEALPDHVWGEAGLTWGAAALKWGAPATGSKKAAEDFREEQRQPVATGQPARWERWNDPLRIPRVLALALWTLKVRPEFERAAEREQRERNLYRFPVVAGGYHRALGGKRHGTDHGLPLQADLGEGGLVRIAVTLPVGAQLELGNRCRIVAKPTDRDENGALRPEAVMRMIAERTGPQVAVMGHVAFALAARHAADEGRTADGRFWLSPSEVGDLLGYRRAPNGRASKTRIGKEAISVIRRNFLTYANTTIEQTMKLPNGDAHRIRGPLLYPTLKEHTERKQGQLGRDRRTEWRIRDELWALTRSRFILVPVALLNSGDEQPRTWAECIRLYEVLACHARNNPEAAAAGDLPLSLEWLATETNLVGVTVREVDNRKRLLAHLEKLKARRALTFKAGVTLADGRQGITFALPEARQAELGAVAGRAAQHRELQARTGPRKRRK